jgi:TPR repeat protein
MFVYLFIYFIALSRQYHDMSSLQGCNPDSRVRLHTLFPHGGHPTSLKEPYGADPWGPLRVPLSKHLACTAEYYCRSAEQGDTYRHCQSGWLIESGFGVEKDLVRAADHYRLSPKHGNCNRQRPFGGFQAEGKSIHTGRPLRRCRLGPQRPQERFLAEGNDPSNHH